MAMERSSIGNVRKDKLRNIFNLFEDTTDETELSKLCEDLINTINEGDKDEQQSALSEATQILVGQIDGKVSGKKIFLSVCKQVGKLDVIPLITAIVTDDSHWWDENGLDNNEIMNTSFCKDLIAAAGEESRYLKLVLEILTSFAPSFTILEVLPNILAIVNNQAEDEPLVHLTLEVYVYAIHDYEACDDKDASMESNLLNSILALSSVLFSKIPNSMDLNREFDHLYTDSQPSCSLLVDAVSWAVRDSKSGFKDFSAAFKVVHVILPIINHVFVFIIQNFVAASELETTKYFLLHTVRFLRYFVSLTKNAPSNGREALELFISSKLIENLLTLQETATRENICCLGQSGSCRHIEECLFFKGVEASFLLLTRSRVKGLCIKEGGFVLIKLLKHFLVNERIFIDEDGKEIDYTKPYGKTCILNVLEKLFRSCPDEFRLCLSDPEENLLPLVIRFASRHPSLLNVACNFMMKIVQKLGIEELFCHLKSFPSICLKHFLSDEELIERSSKLTLEQIVKAKDKDARKDNIIIISAVFIIKRMVLAGTLLELQEMEASFNVVELMMKVFNVSKNSNLLAFLLSILTSAIEKHQKNLLNAGKLVTILPDLWKKNEIPEITNLVRLSVMKFTGKAVLLMPFPSEIDFSDFVPAVTKWCDVKCVSMFKFVDPGLLRLIWELVKHRKHTELFKQMHQLSKNKVVEYSGPGNYGLARIFKLLSDIVIEQLDKNPPHDKEYLIDLTRCMIEIANSRSLDEELYVLEDMVSPAMWLLEKQHDENIVANVKEFVRILHY